eukprot:snap_masked-scaffold_1-processed-gene-16.57-mRNA-1 protein AED:1.00 eAED:1.00 QI:0/0/0/0/1/1/2/0/115
MLDEEIKKIPLELLRNNILYFIWTISSKREVALDLMLNNGINQLIWVRLTSAGNITSTMGNLTGACTEECLIGLRGSFPHTMLKGFLGKEIMFGIKTGNSQKPVELYQLIEKNFK